MTDHDGSYKLLFSQPRMVEDLIRGFVTEPWTAELDFKTLERVPSSYVSDHLARRHEDLVWRLRWGGGDWLYVYLLFEFQSTVDRYMAVRMLGYVALLYQDLIRRRELSPAQRLPPVLPLVVYNGRRRWWAAQEVGELIEPAPPGLLGYQPRLRYLLIDEGVLTERARGQGKNVAAQLFMLERSRRLEEVRSAVRKLASLLPREPDQPLRRAFTSWIVRALLPGRFGSVGEFDAVELEEVKAMLEQTVRRWTREWKRAGLEKGLQKGMQKGMQKGLQKGLQKGMVTGQVRILTRILERRFGPLSASIRRRMAAADAETLLGWADRAVSASTLAEVFEP